MENQLTQCKLLTFILIIWSARYVKIASGVAVDRPIDPAAPSKDLFNSNHALPVNFLVLLASLVILSMGLMVCMDCMNSEVSSESHPASMSAAPKWGGATNYNRAGEGQGGTHSGFVSEVINPSDLRNAPLPYSMVPTQIPDAAEFRGYQASGDGSGMAGYSSVTPSAPSGAGGYGSDPRQAGYSENASGNHGRHYNPADRQDPPPSYRESLQH
ncbi:hypothetical protein EGW08_004238 [Elysia chlorotica]|uniref:Uncharacterized protein n=1 Tax=Elysia chlorotica TaxID=188477 RepID=A0A433U2D6_ELYCH|nr:hypothetical protein EGW08_004238 [Elysia chlorotica]